MATTAMQIFNTAMGFMDEVSTDGKTAGAYAVNASATLKTPKAMTIY